MRTAAILLLVALVLGCSNSEPTRFRVSGNATFDGKPIPAGQIVFTPDGAKKNSGPQGFAIIRDGRFDTSAAEGKGIGGGPTVITITGLAAPQGKPICDYELNLDLPRKDTVQNFDVPAKAGAKAKPEI